MMTDELIAKLEAASGPDVELDGRIYCAINRLVFKSIRPDGSNVHFEIDERGVHTMVTPHPFTASLNAALALVPEGWGWAIDHPSIQLAKRITNGAVVQAEVYDGKGLIIAVRAPTPALALCIASMKARGETA